MDDAGAVARGMPPDVVDNVVVVWVSSSEWRACLDVADLGLLRLDSGKGGAVALVEVAFLAE